MRSLLSAMVIAVAAATLIQLAAPVADAKQRRRGADPGYGYVTADSRYSGASITAPVRYGPHGRLEVRLPGGTWLECGRSCRDTLRRETIDFWYSQDRKGDGPGYLQFRF
jgi:hypothetical protein